MSRSGRAVDLLADWKDHPKGCTATHGWADGYTGPCTDDEWDIVQSLGHIDPWFHHDLIERLRAVVHSLGGSEVLDAYDRDPYAGRQALDALVATYREAKA